MPTARKPVRVTREIAELFASNPTPEDLLTFHPSEAVQERARELLDKLRANQLTPEEQWELDQFQHAESLMQLVKARIRASPAKRP